MTEATSAAPENFESALAELETIVERMESGQLGLQDALAAHRRGAELLRYCQTALQDAEQQVKILEADLLQNFGDADDHAA